MSSKGNGDMQVGYGEPPKVVMVTPEMAYAWVDAGTESGVNTHNRALRQNRIDKYARDMKAGRWLLTHQGIAFSKDGRLIDGQHRLWAVIESGATVPMLVHHGLEMLSQTVIDTASGRTIQDRLYLADEFGEVTRLEAQSLRYLITRTQRRFTAPEETDAFRTYRAGIRFVIRALGSAKSKIARAPVIAAIVRAYYSGVKKDLLTSFCRVLETGEKAGWAGDPTAVRLRDLLLEGMPMPDAYWKTTSALKNYLEGKAASRIFSAPFEQFHVDGLNIPYQGGTPARVKKATKSSVGWIMDFFSSRPNGATVREYADFRQVSPESVNGIKPVFDDLVSRGWLKSGKVAGKRGAVYTLAGRA